MEKIEKVFKFCIEYTKDTEDRLRRKDQIYLKKVILEEYEKFINSGLASVVLEMNEGKLYQIDPIKILAIVLILSSLLIFLNIVAGSKIFIDKRCVFLFLFL